MLGSMASIGVAQSPTASVVSGTTTIMFDSNFVNGLHSLGATMFDQNSQVLPNNTISFPAVTGAVDTMTVAGEIEHTGGIIVNANGNFIRLENLTLDMTTPSAPVITSDIVFFNRFQGRIQLFNFVRTRGFSVSSDLFTENALTLTLAPGVVSTLNTLFGTQALRVGTFVGTANVSTNLAPVN